MLRLEVAQYLWLFRVEVPMRLALRVVERQSGFGDLVLLFYDPGLVALFLLEGLVEVEVVVALFLEREALDHIRAPQSAEVAGGRRSHIEKVVLVARREDERDLEIRPLVGVVSVSEDQRPLLLLFPVVPLIGRVLVDERVVGERLLVDLLRHAVLLLDAALLAVLVLVVRCIPELLADAGPWVARSKRRLVHELWV